MIRAISAFFLIALTLMLIPGGVRAGPVELPDGRTLAKVDFDRHVHALLDRQGCNAGACHGNRDGKGGFALSLFAESPTKDHAEIVRSMFGRYLNVTDPERSLLLLKATGQPKHEGGMRIAPRSWEYQLLKAWIADGAGRDSMSGQVTALHVHPSEHIFQPGEKLQLKVIAQFADGSKEDVTCFSDFRGADFETLLDKKEPAPLHVSRTGEVYAVKACDVGIGVFYRGQARVMRARVAVKPAKEFVYPKVPETNFIDREVFGKLRKLNIVPADLCSDEQFLRRIYIDLIGAIPTPAEVRAFVASKDADKRLKKIDELLAHPRHAALLATRFCESIDLIGEYHDHANSPRAKAAQMAHAWLRKRFHDNMPYDRIVEKVLTATSKDGRDDEAWKKEKFALEAAKTGFGSDYAKRQTLDHYWRLDLFGRRSDDIFGDSHPNSKAEPIEALAERTAATFLGVNLECARCHLHPTDGWTVADHRAFANVFAQVRVEKASVNPKLPYDKQKLQLDRLAVAREIYLDKPANLRVHPESGAVLKPRILGGPEFDFQGDARLAFARWLARPDNPFFARHFVNEMWVHYFGVSLVESTDSYTSAFAPANNTLLELLAKDFIDHKFDVRRLERTILLSRTYQLAMTVHESNKHDRASFSRVIPRRINARVAADILHTTLDTTENYGDGVPAGLAPIEVMHLGNVGREQSLRTPAQYKERIDRLLSRFGRQDLMSRCDREPGNLSSLFLYGNAEANALVKKSKRIDRLAKSAQLLDEIIDECFLAALSRLPSADHRKVCTDLLERDAKMRRHNLENIFWALMNSKEFMMRH